MDIKVVGARENNLKNINVSIPSKKLIVLTGVSGSGKSSLAFDTIHKEGQRRYLETFSSYARNFIGSFERPNVDYINGLSPVIAIEQKTISKNPRSTVGTITEIYDYLRLLYAKISIPHSFNTNERMTKQDTQYIINNILDTYNNKEILILSPKVKSRKGHYADLFQNLRQKGYAKVFINEEIRILNTNLRLDRYKTHDIDIVIDKLTVKGQSRNRLKKSIEVALNESDGSFKIIDLNINQNRYFSKHLTCPTTGISYEDPEPNSFSFNSPKGYCKYCKGLGIKEEMDLSKIIPNKEKSIMNGGIEAIGEYKKNWIFNQIELIAKKYNFSISEPIKNIKKDYLDLILYGTKQSFKVKNKQIGVTKKYDIEFEGIISFIEEQKNNNKSQKVLKWVNKFYQQKKCSECNGDKLKKESLHFFIAKKNISEITKYNIFELKKWCLQLIQNTSGNKTIIAQEILKELLNRLDFLINIGLGYITIDRRTDSLSGGESQRIKIAAQIGSELTNVLYILDEPSIGLHPSDNKLLIDSLTKLKNLGNTVIVVEHDQGMMKAADFIIDIGPGAGEFGGEILYAGTYNNLKKVKSLTSDFLFRKDNKKLIKKNRKGNNKQITLIGANGNNLQNINITFPLGKLILITGVSGSGKSTLINGTLYPAINNIITKKRTKKSYQYQSIEGVENIDKIINIDQSAIGRTPRSNPATFTGVFTEIRKLFASLNESKIRGYSIGRFSFNVKEGNCEQCEGNGIITVQMKLLPDFNIPCKSCNGKRFNPETLEIKYNNKNIFNILEMSINEGVVFFKNFPKIKSKLIALKNVGMGYVKIGQSSTTLSGGEAQRVKLGAELSKKDTGNTLYILDEPTTGLHFKDIHTLMKSINLLIEKGNSVIIIEHNLDVIKHADHIIELGPKGGKEGGNLVYQGDLNNILNNKISQTAVFLKKEISSHNE